MKTLIFVRHAKSSWSNPDLDDEDRPLNKRGKRDAPIMGERLKARDVHADLLLSSHAMRARKTAKKIALAIGYPKSDIQLTSDLYHAGVSEMLEVIRSLPEDLHTVMLFGHNPGFTYMVNELANTDIDNIPTCGIAAISFGQDRWSQIAPRTGKLLFYDYPKKL